jgi:hypothetical protein
VFRIPVVSEIRPRMPGLAHYRACRGQAGAAAGAMAPCLIEIKSGKKQI